MPAQPGRGAKIAVRVCGIFFSLLAVVSLLAGHLDKMALYVVIAVAAFVYAATIKVKSGDGESQTTKGAS